MTKTLKADKIIETLIYVIRHSHPHQTITGLKSFLEAYKFLTRAIPNCWGILPKLETIVAGRASNFKIIWTDSNILEFKDTQKSLESNKTILIPKADD